MENLNCKAIVISTLLSEFSTHPVEYVKTAKQNKTKLSVKQFINNPFKGFGSRIIGSLPMRGIYFNLTNYFNNQNYNPFVSGLLISLAQTSVDYPMEVTKTQRIISNYNWKKAFKSVNHTPSLGYHLIRNQIFATSVSTYISDNENQLFNAGIGALIGSAFSQPFDCLKTWFQSGNKTFPYKWKLKDYYRGGLYRCSASMIGLNIGWVSFNYFKK